MPPLDVPNANMNNSSGKKTKVDYINQLYEIYGQLNNEHFIFDDEPHQLYLCVVKYINEYAEHFENERAFLLTKYDILNTYKYSNDNYSILSMIVRVNGKKPFKRATVDDHLRENFANITVRHNNQDKSLTLANVLTDGFKLAIPILDLEPIRNAFGNKIEDLIQRLKRIDLKKDPKTKEIQLDYLIEKCKLLGFN